MSADFDVSPRPEPAAGPPRRVRGLQTGMRSLLLMVACFGAIFWAWRHASENADPIRVEVRAIQERAIGKLRSSRPEDRISGIQLLQHVGADLDVGTRVLIEALHDPAREVRVAAAEGLINLCSMDINARSVGKAVRAVVPALIEGLKDPDQAVRLTAIQYLGEIGSRLSRAGAGPETVEEIATTLVPLMKDGDPAVRSTSVMALKTIVASSTPADDPIDPNDLNGMLAAMLDDPVDDVRIAAVQALAARPLEGAPPDVLARAFQDPSPKVRASAVVSLWFYRRGLEPWISILLRLAEHDPDEDVRTKCLLSLNLYFRPATLAPEIVPDLIAGLKSASPAIRGKAASILAELEQAGRPAIPGLLRVLNEPAGPYVVPTIGPDETFDPGCAAAHALGRLAPGTPEEQQVIAALTEAARSGPVNRRGWAAAALGRFGPAAVEAVPVLIQLLKDALPDDRPERTSWVAEAIGKIAPGSPMADRTIEALRPALKSKSNHLRTGAMKALAAFGPRAAPALPDLRALEDDRDIDIRKGAAEALKGIENQEGR